MELFLCKWITSSTDTCEQCKELDGKEFKRDKVPELPHPNCKCTVETIQNPEALEALEKENEKLQAEIYLTQETKKKIQDGMAKYYQQLMNNPQAKQKLNVMYEELAEHQVGLLKAQSVLEIFIKEYATMVDADTIGADKFYHVIANAQAAQQGRFGWLKFGEFDAIILSFLREEVSNFNDSRDDKNADYEANALGRKIGSENPYASREKLTEIIKNHGIDTSGAKPRLGLKESADILTKKLWDKISK